MKIFLIIAGSLLLIILLVAITGALLPRGHKATRLAKYKLSPEKIFAMITDHKNHPSWRGELKSVEIVTKDGKTFIKEESSFGPMTLEVVEHSPPRRYVTKIADEDLAFGGSWTFEIEPDGAGSKLRITEDGEVKNIFFRFMSKFIFGHTSTLEGYLKSLGAKLGETVAIEP